MDVTKKYSQDREEMIKDMVENEGISRERAEFITAIEFGDIPGDVIIVDDEDSDEPGSRPN